MVRALLRRLRWGPPWIAALWLCCAARLRAQEDVPLAIEAPDQLVLGATSDVLLQISAPSPLTATFSTNIGRLGAPEPSGPGQWIVRYTPPSSRYPQVAILALVSADGEQAVWKRMALYGGATVELRSDPHVQVSVKVGDKTFGPVQTDAKGAAALPVIVPPGVSRAVSAATDALGNERVESIPLDVPEISPLLAVCPPEDGRDFLVFAARSDATPAARLSLATTATTVLAGEISEPEPGVYRTALTIPTSVRTGERARLSVAIAGKPTAASSCELAVPLERPRKLRIELSRGRFAAAQSEPIRVRVVPEYDGAREKAAFTLGFKVDLGSLSETRVSAREPVELSWKLPHGLGGRSEARLSVTGDLRRMFVLPLSAADLAQLAPQLSESALPADGRSSARLRVSARDAYDNPVRGLHLTAEARGVIGELTEAEPGDYEADYYAALGEPGRDEIIVRDPASGQQARTELELLSASGRFSLAAHAGYLTNFARVAGPVFALELGYRLPVLSERLSLALRAGYYQSSRSVAAADGGARLATRLWAFPLLLRVAYTIPLGALDLSPMLGAGLLAASTKHSGADTGTVEERHLVPLFTGALDASIQLGPGRLGLELGYLLASLHGESVHGNAGGAYIALGYALQF